MQTSKGSYPPSSCTMCKTGFSALHPHPAYVCPEASRAVAKVGMSLNFEEESRSWKTQRAGMVRFL